MKIFIQFIIFFIPIFCLTQNNEEKQIYSTLLSENFSKASKKIVIQKQTYSLNRDKIKDLKYNFLKTNFKKLELETFNDFIAKNKSEFIIQTNFDKKLNVAFIDKKEMNLMFKNHTGWDDFYKKYKNAIGIVEFSRVGFNKNNTQAFLYLSKSSGFLNAYGNYVFFEKKNGKWKQTMTTMAWIS